MPRKSNTQLLDGKIASRAKTHVTKSPPAPLPVESDAESATEEIAAEEIPSMNSEPTKAVEEPPDTKMKEDKVEEEEDEEDGEE